MTKATRARCRNRPTSEKLMGSHLQPSFADLLTGDHTILSLLDKLRDYQANAHIVQDGYSYWLQSSPTPGCGLFLLLLV